MLCTHFFPSALSLFLGKLESITALKPRCCLQKASCLLQCHICCFSDWLISSIMSTLVRGFRSKHLCVVCVARLAFSVVSSYLSVGDGTCVLHPTKDVNVFVLTIYFSKLIDKLFWQDGLFHNNLRFGCCQNFQDLKPPRICYVAPPPQPHPTSHTTIPHTSCPCDPVCVSLL